MSQKCQLNQWIIEVYVKKIFKSVKIKFQESHCIHYKNKTELYKVYFYIIQKCKRACLKYLQQKKIKIMKRNKNAVN